MPYLNERTIKVNKNWTCKETLYEHSRNNFHFALHHASLRFFLKCIYTKKKLLEVEFI